MRVGEDSPCNCDGSLTSCLPSAPRENMRRSEYVCVDKDAIGIGSTANENGHLLYPVEVQSMLDLGYNDFSRFLPTSALAWGSEGAPSTPWIEPPYAISVGRMCRLPVVIL